MGCGAVKDEKGVEKKENPPPCDCAANEKKIKDLQKKLDDANAEIGALKAELKARENKIQAVAKQEAVSGGITLQLVLTGEQVGKVSAMPDVSVSFVQGPGVPLHEDRENVVNVTCKKEALPDVIAACVAPADVVRKPKPIPDAPPPPIEKEVEKPPDEEEKPKIAVPDQTVPVSTNIDLGAWDGTVPLTFQWVDEPSPFSEFNDPSGDNWSCFTNVRKAPGKPKNVHLEWRQGMTGEWTSIPANEKYSAQMTLKPEEVSGSAYRGYQSRWVVDGDKYLSPLQLAPTLQSKLMTYPAVRSAIKALPEDKQSIDNIENENLRKALMTVENIIPMNTWDVDYGITKMPGAYLNGEHVLTMVEKVEMIAKLKSSDPAIQSEARKTILKSPIMGANAAAGTVGVKLDIIVKNMDFFLPKMTDPDFEQMQSIEDKPLQWEILRREMQTDVNELYPTFQNGIRVTFPPTRVIKNAMDTKRPTADPNNTLPFAPKFVVKEDEMALQKHEVAFVFWRDGADYSTKIVTPLDAREEIEKFGISREEKPVWKNYSVEIKAIPAVYRYHWMIDGQPYFNNGKPYNEEFKVGVCYETFSLMCKVQFGIGVAV